MLTLFQKNMQSWSQHLTFKPCNAQAFKTAKAFIAGLVFVQSSCLLAQSPSNQPQQTLTLQDTIEIALSNDEWLTKSELTQSRLNVLSEGADAMPDPTFSLGLLNFPTNGFAINQEPMTQIKVGASQMFPRGDSLSLQEKKFTLIANEQPYLREERRLKLTQQTTHLWLDAFEASASYQLVNEARPLFDKLGDIVSASYASSAGKANQQDIIRAELELVRLNDRLISLDTKKRVALSTLSKFLLSTSNNVKYSTYIYQSKMPPHLDKVDASTIEKLMILDRHDEQGLYEFIETHPLIDATEQRVRASNVDIELAEQAYKPQYAVNASYALRDDAPNGQSRADFISIGASVSVPLFSKKRQDANLAGAKLMTEAIRTEKLLIMRELMSGLSSAYQQYTGLSERFAIYRDTIVPQMKHQSAAALNAYTNDIGDFAEVVRAKIAELDAQIMLLNIDVSKRKALSNIDYFSPIRSNTYSSAKALLQTGNKDNTHD